MSRSGNRGRAAPTPRLGSGSMNEEGNVPKLNEEKGGLGLAVGWEYSPYAPGQARTCGKRWGVRMLLAVTPGLNWCAQSQGAAPSLVSTSKSSDMGPIMVPSPLLRAKDRGQERYVRRALPCTRTTSRAAHRQTYLVRKPRGLFLLTLMACPCCITTTQNPPPAWAHQSSCTRPWHHLPENTSPLRRPRLSVQRGVAAHGHRGDSERARLDCAGLARRRG